MISHRHIDGPFVNRVYHTSLYNLEASGAPLVRRFDAATSSSTVVFSPRGRYLLYARLTAPTNTSLRIVDAVSGAERYQSQFTFQAPAVAASNRRGTAAARPA